MWLLHVKNGLNGPDDRQDGTKMARDGAVLVQIVQIITHPFAQMIEKHLLKTFPDFPIYGPYDTPILASVEEPS